MNLRQDQATGTGDICGTGDDNSYAVVEELRMTFPHTGSFNPEAIDEVPLRDEQKWMGKPLEYAKVSRATRKLANGRPGGNASPSCTECPTRRLTKTLRRGSSSRRC